MTMSWNALLRRLETFPVTVQLVRIDGRRWAHVPGAATATAEEIALPNRIQLDEHTGLIVRGWGALTAAQRTEIEQLIAAAGSGK
jgi:hypothetical protein